MHSIGEYLQGIAFIGFLMIIHESGHYFVARAFGMRVLKFSLGIGPALWKIKPKGSDTVFQIAPIPFFAFVQIDGMNPLDEIDPEDKGSYANASTFARICTIFAGPLANFVLAALLFFTVGISIGKPLPRKPVLNPMKGKPAMVAGVKKGDVAVAVAGTRVKGVDHFIKLTGARGDKATEFIVLRGEKEVKLTIKPELAKDSSRGLIGVIVGQQQKPDRQRLSFGQALKYGAVEPARVVHAVLLGIGKTLKTLVTGRGKVRLGGPALIVKESARRARLGFFELAEFMAFLSANLAAMNMLPVPALDGGRLLFLGYEVVSRKRVNAMAEAQIHLVGFLMLLGLMIFVTWNDLFGGK